MKIGTHSEQELRKKFLFLSDGSFIIGNGILGKGCCLWNGRTISNSNLGAYSYTISNLVKVAIGNYSSIAHNVNFATPHPVDRLTTSPLSRPDPAIDHVFRNFGKKEAFENLPATTIGSDVWIGTDVTIKCGVNIGDGAIVGMGAAITKDVPPFAIVGGVPAKIIRMRFAQSIIERILKTRWFEYDWEGFSLDWADPMRALDQMECAINENRVERLIFYNYLVRNEQLLLKACASTQSGMPNPTSLIDSDSSNMASGFPPHADTFAARAAQTGTGNPDIINIAQPDECSPNRSLEKLYLYTLKNSLLGDFYLEDDARFLYIGMQLRLGRQIDLNALREPRKYLSGLYENIKQIKSNGGPWYRIAIKNQDGGIQETNLQNYTDWAYSMIGQKRMQNIEDCLDIIRIEDIPGDLVETGVCRGGAVIFMQGYLKTYKMGGRKIIAADSFRGLPVGKNEDLGVDLSSDKFPTLAVSLERVKETFSRYGLLDENVIFLKGWFCDTLPKIPTDRIALLRMDGDLYESTMDTFNNLYDKVVLGGFIIIDDYKALSVCQKAVDEFRVKRGISEPMIEIDPWSVYWRKA